MKATLPKNFPQSAGSHSKLVQVETNPIEEALHFNETDRRLEGQTQFPSSAHSKPICDAEELKRESIATPEVNLVMRIVN